MHRLLTVPMLLLVGSCADMCGECFEDDDCRGGDVCVEGLCLECERDRDCDADETCEDGECEREKGGPGDPCADDSECIPETVCFNEFCVGNGFLRISLAFPVDADFDLHVVTPTGAEIFYGDREHDGGALDVDQCISPCGEGVHVENVVFLTTAPAGVYTVFVQNFDGRAGGPFSITVAGEVEHTFTGALPATSRHDSEPFTFEL